AYNFYVRAIDAAQNVSAPASATWTVDRIAPTIQIDTTPPQPTNLATTSVTFHSPSDASATYVCSTDNVTYAACSSPQTFSAPAGQVTTFNFYVKAKDAAGNLSASPATATWTVDRQLPTITLDSTPPQPTNLATT